MQMGGSDQWGNIVTGTELIRRKAGGEAFAFTCPLIKKADGTKFGKSEKGNVWLDPAKTSPYEFYQFWIKSSDEDARDWIKIFTFLPQDEINDIITHHNGQPEKRLLQRKLAEEVTILVHGKEELEKAIETTKKLHEGGGSVDTLSLNDLESMEGVVKYDFDAEKIRKGIDVVSFLAETGIFKSKGDARKMIQNGGISINRNKVSEVALQVNEALLLHQQYILVQKGKNNYFLVKAL